LNRIRWKIKLRKGDIMIFKCKCGKVQSMTIGKRLMIGNWVMPFFIGGCGDCGTTWIWIFGWGLEIRRI
jgi:hypothetical protein